MRQPVAHHGQQLVDVVDMGGDEQRAVAVLAVLLLGQQGAAGEVVGHFRGDAQQHFGGFIGKPHVVFGGDVVQVAALGGEAGGGVHLQLFNQRDAEVFQAGGFFGGQVPHAVFVDQAVGLGVAGLAFVGEAAGVVLFDGRLQRGEGVGAAVQVFMRYGLDVGGAALLGGVQLFQQVGQAAVRKQMLGAGHAGVVVQVFGGDGAAGFQSQLPLALGIAFGDALQALVQVALDGADVGAKFSDQLVLVDGFALVQPGDDAGQALGEFSSFGVGGGAWCGGHGQQNVGGKVWCDSANVGCGCGMACRCW